MSIRRWGNRTALVATTALLATVGVSVAPANAGLLDGTLRPLVGTLGGTTSALVRTVDGVLGSLLGPTGWLVEDGTTSLGHVSDVIGATQVRAQGFDGRGVGVALIDTGVAPVPGLSSGNVVNGPDLSFESQSPEHRYLDTFGHGTHMAGIIAGTSPGRCCSPVCAVSRPVHASPASRWRRPRAPSTSRRSSPLSTGWWRTGTTTRRTRSG